MLHYNYGIILLFVKIRKQLVRQEIEELFNIYYNTNKANYNNKTFYEFFINRDIKLGLKRILS